MTISYVDLTGTTQSVSFTKTQIVNGGTPFTYDAVNHTLTFDVTNYASYSNILVEYYVKTA